MYGSVCFGSPADTYTARQKQGQGPVFRTVQTDVGNVHSLTAGRRRYRDFSCEFSPDLRNCGPEFTFSHIRQGVKLDLGNPAIFIRNTLVKIKV
jgi:hypothetical protein